MRYVSILRGINVGGKRKILMADLADLFRELGFSDIVTYIQSGNVIFTCEARDIPMLETTISDAIRHKYGWVVPVMVRTTSQIQNCLNNNHFETTENMEDKHLYVTFLQRTPDTDLIASIHHEDFLPDRFQIVDNHVYGYCHGKYSESKLTNQFFEQKLKVAATTRNWITVKKLVELSASK